jgi:HAD superfamily hydrolase (TIGR01509 family)
MNSTLKAVVFDLDGLMFNTEDLYQEVGGLVLERRGKAFTTELLDAMMGRPTQVAIQIMIDWHDLDVTVEQLQEESEAAFPAVLDAKLAPMPGLMDLLETLEQHEIPKAVATSSRRSFVTDVLSRFGLMPRFEFVLTCEDIVHGKPAPDIYELAARRLNIACAEMMVLEDSENGCKAAVAAGAFAVAVPGTHSRNHDFSGTQFQAESLADPRIYAALRVPQLPDVRSS